MGGAMGVNGWRKFILHVKEVVSNYNKEVMSLEYKVLEKRWRL